MVKWGTEEHGNNCWSGEIGIHIVFRTLRAKVHAGSSPASSTIAKTSGLVPCVFAMGVEGGGALKGGGIPSFCEGAEPGEKAKT